MSRSVSNVNISTDSFLTWITQTNKLLEALRTDVITVSTSITGGNATLANTTGNAQLIGIFGANTVVATDGLRGGNASATNVLNILSNTSVTGDFLKVGANVQLNAISVSVGNSTINLVATQNLLKISNSTSTANLSPLDLTIGSAVVNATVLTIGTGNFSTGANVGANVNFTTSSALIGNSVANVFANSILIKVSNSTSTANITPLDLTIGSASVNSSVITIGTGNFSTGANVGANVNITTSSAQIGNSTANLFANSILLKVSNSTSTANLTPKELTIGTTVVNSSLVTVTGVNTSYANVTGQVNTATLYATTSANIGTAFTANASLVNAIALNVVNQTNTATLFATTSANVGGNVQMTVSQYGITGSATVPTMALTTSALTIGNSTVTGAPSINLANSTGNTTVNAIAIGSSWGLNSNSSGVYHSGVVNAASHTVGSSFIANSTAIIGTGYANVTTSVNSALLTVGTNFIANTTALVHTGYANVSTSVNSASHTVGTNFIANTTALVHTGYANVTTSVNSALLTVGSAFTANATLVNAAALNVVNQVNTATIFSSTSANVGANVQLTTSQLFIGNSIANAISNSTIVTLANSTSTANLQPGALTIGGSSVNTTYIVANNLVINTDCEMRVSSNTLNANITSAQVFFTFATSFSSAKITAQVKRSGNVQTSDMIIAHDGTDAFISVYGTVIAPSTSSDLGDFSVGVNAGNVELKYQQTAASSVIKVIAHLIK